MFPLHSVHVACVTHSGVYRPLLRGEVTSQQSVVSMLWGNTAYCAKLNGEDVSPYSNKIESVGLRKCTYYHCFTTKTM